MFGGVLRVSSLNIKTFGGVICLKQLLGKNFPVLTTMWLLGKIFSVLVVNNLPTQESIKNNG